MKRTTQRKRTAAQTAATTADRHRRRTRRQILKTMAGAMIGGAVAGPVGVAAGAIVGASVRHGPVRQRRPAVAKAKSPGKTKPRKTVGEAKRRPTRIYPNVL